MGSNSKIEWTTHTFNPWIGCTKVSGGCTNCYAEREDKRRSWTPDGWGKGNPRKRTSVSNWRKPIKWNKEAAAEGIRRKIFCASLADWADQEVPDAWRNDLFDLADQCLDVDWLMLTKRTDKAVEYLLNRYGSVMPSHIWPGVSVENQPTADERLPKLMQLRASVLWASVEPLLGPIDFRRLKMGTIHKGLGRTEPLTCSAFEDRSFFFDEGDVDFFRLNWLIVGGESGPKARLMDPEWARSIRDQCVQEDTAFFFKQWGEWAMATAEAGTLVMPKKGMPMVESPEGSIMWKMGKKIAGRKLDGHTWSQFPGAPVLT